MTNLEFAIKMELDGEQYYLRQAELNDDQGIKVVCNLLAEDERRHAQVLTDKSNQVSYKLEDSNILTNTKNVFSDRGDIIVADKARAKQEEKHLQILDNLTAMLRHAEEWVEDAEFGVRPEY